MTDFTARLFEDRALRTVVKPSFPVVEVPPDAGGTALGGLLPPTGSVVVYFGDPTAPAWRDLRDAVTRQDWEKLRDSTASRVAKGWTDDDVLASPVYFDVRCAGRTLIQQMALLAGHPYGTLTFPYTGGLIEDTDFEIVEYHRTRDVSSLGYVFARRAPELTPLEQRLVATLGPDLRELNVGPHLPCQTTTFDQVCEVVEQAARAELTRRHGCVDAEGPAKRLPDDLVEAIAGQPGEPAVPVAELLAIRRRILGG
ncbi:MULTISPECIES: hypothetical protein [Amycolatopsis]|uniref:Uncharacterized protein n=2 Tax=Amycolatopsis TaxID=1813 RepID=A0A1I3WPU4_9PSEU|nr:hypothetical protein [Amycolatopsis sacchari]SFK08496.1 hypothetical protein SAMN05421835_113129 [Amycolatopsis sacchari]